MPETTATHGIDAVLLRAEVEELLYEEAARLSRRDFQGWLELYTDDATYWIPSSADDIDPSREVSIVFDRRQQLGERVWRLDSGLAYAQEPRSRAVHAVSNVRLLDSAGEDLHVESVLNVTEFRRERLHHHAGRCLHHLRRVDGRLAIALKKIELVNNDGHLGNLSILL